MGVYSLLAYRVARQQKEIAVRMTLGAARQTVVRMVVARTLRGILLGVAAGSAGAFVLSRAFRSLFTGAAALDTGALAQTALVLLAVAMLASVAPSYRAVRLDPSATLRGE
jgi:ABC-type antimicrobial peptide transport system permease subunit